MPATSSYSPTGDLYVDGVLGGVKWAVNSFTFSFPTDPSFYGTGYPSGEPTNNFQAFNAAQQTAVRKILQMYSAVANVTFAEVTETASQHGDLRYAETDAVSTAWGYYPSTSAAGGDTWFNNSKHYYDSPLKGSYAWLTILHETGHAMGLKHAHESAGSFGAMPSDRDSLEYTVMSYRSYVGGPATSYTVGSTSYPQTLMMYDIAALQKLYGANFTTNGGDTVYAWSATTGEMFVNAVGQGAPAGNKILMTISDGGGNDTYDFSNYTTNLSVSLQPGSWTTVSTTQLASLGSGHYAAGNIANALLFQGNLASLIEAVIGGSGSDAIMGNVAGNRFTGNGGNDTFDGGAGNDTAVYSGASADYTVVQNADGSWTVTDLRIGSPDGIDTLRNMEFLQFSNTTVTIGTITPPPPPPPVNSAPTITSLLQSASLSEWADLSVNETANTPHTASGTITFMDADSADTHAASFVTKGTGYLGTFSLAALSQAGDSVGWSFSIADSAMNYLAAGQTRIQSYDVTVDDAHGGTATQTVTITLIGTADGTTTTKGGPKGKGQWQDAGGSDHQPNTFDGTCACGCGARSNHGDTDGDQFPAPAPDDSFASWLVGGSPGPFGGPDHPLLPESSAAGPFAFNTGSGEDLDLVSVLGIQYDHPPQLTLMQ